MSGSSSPLVAVRLPPGAAFLDVLDDAWSRGMAVLPLEPAWPDPVTSAVLDAMRPARVVDAGGWREREHGLPVPDGTALVVLTSGTSGSRKGVLLSHEALEAAVRASLARLGSAPQARWLACLPFTHVAGVLVILRARMVGTEPIVHRRFDVAAVAHEAAATHVSLVPTMLRRLLDAGADVSHFDRVLLGGARPSTHLLERAGDAGAAVTVTYGMTETCGGCVYDGVALDGVDVAVDAPDGDVGPIRIRGPVLSTGYRTTGRDLPLPTDEDGWFATADLGRRREDGSLEVVGRVDDVILTGGENVVPGEVEALLRTHPRIADAAVVGRPDPEWGQRVVAYCVPATPDDPPDGDGLRAYVAERAPAHLVPKDVVLLDELPRNAMGKVARTRLAGRSPRQERSGGAPP